MKKKSFFIFLLLYVFCAIRLNGQTEELLSIKNNAIDSSTGIGNVYTPYSFYAESPYTITSYLWTYEVKNNDNTFETVATNTSPDFSISPLTLNDNYYRTENGDVCGKITLQATVNGMPASAEFTIWLEASPGDIEYEVNIIKVNEWYYDMEVTAYSAGATDWTINFTNYSAGAGLTTIFHDQQSVNYAYGPLYYNSPILIKFLSRNSYGSKSNSYYTDGVSYTALLSPKEDCKIEKIEVYTITGSLKLVTDANVNVQTLNLEPGIYIVKTIYDNGTYSSKKIIKAN